MRGKPLFLVAVLFAFAPAAFSQTIYQEGRGTFLRVTPIAISLADGSSSYQAASGFTHRLSRHADLGVSASYQDDHYSAVATLGYTAQLSEAGWGMRPQLSAGRNSSASYLSGSFTLFRQLGYGEMLTAFPLVSLTPVLLEDDGVEGGLGAGVAVPLYLVVWRSAHVFITPSYGVSLLPDFHFSDDVRLGFGAQLSF